MYEGQQPERDLKSLSLHLFDRTVIIIPKEGTESIRKYGREITGRLTGRVWGNKSINDHKTETIVALQISSEGNDLLIPCDEIEALKGA